ncbi:hypothetical protein J3S90_15710, partial [Flavobacterium sp. P4023]
NVLALGVVGDFIAEYFLPKRRYDKKTLIPLKPQSRQTAVSRCFFIYIVFLSFMNKLNKKKVIKNIINWIKKTGYNRFNSAYL